MLMTGGLPPGHKMAKTIYSTYMSKKKRLNVLPPKSEIPTGVIFMLANARRHLKAAEILRDHRLYGVGLSHVVLASEELAKALILTLEMMGMDIPQDFQREVLQHHTPRHGFTLGLLFSRAVRKFAFGVLAGSFASRGGSLERSLQREIKLVKAGRSPHFAFLDWIKDANDQKNRGFYVDFHDDRWKHPGTVNKRTFIYGYSIVKDLLDEQSRFIKRVHKNRFTLPAAVKKQFEEFIEKAEALNGMDLNKELLRFIVS
jgi:AbiV family abortive infection protein